MGSIFTAGSLPSWGATTTHQCIRKGTATPYSPNVGEGIFSAGRITAFSKFARDVLGSQGGGTAIACPGLGASYGPILPRPVPAAVAFIGDVSLRLLASGPEPARAQAKPSAAWSRTRARPAPRRRTPRLGRRTSGGRTSPPRPLRRASPWAGARKFTLYSTVSTSRSGGERHRRVPAGGVGYGTRDSPVEAAPAG